MRLRELQYYPRRKTPININSPLDLVQLDAIRREHNRSNSDLPYDIIGNDELVESWIIFGRAKGLLTMEWTAQLDKLAEMGRGPSNKIVMANDAPKFQGPGSAA